MDTSFGPLTHLGRYKIVRQIGRGSMGVVYEGLDPRLNRPVAIKTILKGHLADEDMAADYALRFQREAQAVGRLTHPHIVTLYDFGDEQEVTYIVMEFIRGRELASHFEAGEYFDLPQSVRIMGELLDALAYAHEHGIVHRDIKPANVMLDEEGHVKLTDFGVARVTDANTDRTQPGTMVGTPSYMSPEQILGMAVGSRADLFAAGVVLYQFLTHDKPFKGNGPWDVQRKIVSDEPTPPSKLNPALPRAFDAVVAKALAKKPEHRYANANAFAADLRLALNSTSPAISRTAAKTAPKFAAQKAPQAAQAMAESVDLPLDLEATEAQAPTPELATAPVEPRAASARRRLRWLTAAALALASLVAVGWFWWQAQIAQPENPAQRPADFRAPVVAPASKSEPSPVPAAEAASATMTLPVAASEPASAPDIASQPTHTAPAAVIPRTRGQAASSVVDPRPALRQNAGSSARRGNTEALPNPTTERRNANPRCADLLQQAQLGETLSPESLAFLRKECRS